MSETLSAPAKAAGPLLRNSIAVASGKGGVGKTWLSITICHVMAKRGMKVLLFDGDLGLANIDIQLGLAPDRDLGGVLAGRYLLRDATERYAEGGFDVIAGRSGSGTLAGMPSEQLARLGAGLAQIAPAYDRIVLDLGAGVERTVREFAALSKTCLVIATDEPTAMTDAYAFIKLSRMHNPTGDLRLVINMAPSRNDGERTYATLRKACQSFLKTAPPLAGVIRRDPKVREAIRHQTSLLVRHPNTLAASDVEALVQRLTEAS